MSTRILHAASLILIAIGLILLTPAPAMADDVGGSDEEPTPGSIQPPPLSHGLKTLGPMPVSAPPAPLPRWIAVLLTRLTEAAAWIHGRMEWLVLSNPLHAGGASH